GLLTPDQVSKLLQKRQADQLAAARPSGSAMGGPTGASRSLSAAERRIALRKQLNALVAAQHHATNVPHGKIHAELRRRCGGPPSAQATIEQLEQRIDAIKEL